MTIPKTVISIFGTIGGEVFADTVSQAFQAADGRPVRLEIASPGGSPTEAYAIAQLIQEYPASVTAEIWECLSAALLIAAAADERIMDSDACMFFHTPAAILAGNVFDLVNDLESLQAQNLAFEETLAAGFGVSLEVISELQRGARFLGAAEALALGLVDAVRSGPTQPMSEYREQSREVRADIAAQSAVTNLNRSTSPHDSARFQRTLAVAGRNPIFAAARPKPRVSADAIEALTDSEVIDLHAHQVEAHRRRESATRLSALRTGLAADAAARGYAPPQLEDAWLCGGCGQFNTHPWETAPNKLTPCRYCQTIIPIKGESQ